MSERGVPVTGVSELVLFEGAGRAAYVKDPDGNVVELWTWDVAGHLR
jgi:catechol-2,3-dioxygenase